MLFVRKILIIKDAILFSWEILIFILLSCLYFKVEMYFKVLVIIKNIACKIFHS